MMIAKTRPVSHLLFLPLLMPRKDPCLYHQRVDQARSTLYLYASTKTIAIVGLEPLQIIQGLGSSILLLSWADMLLAS
jgi:hypothetical protein